MKVIFAKALFLVGLFPFLSVAAGTAQSQTSLQIHISYPKIKESKPFFVFLSKKNMGKIDYGQRFIYNCHDEGNLKVTIGETERYIEPRTISNNTRTINCTF